MVNRLRNKIKNIYTKEKFFPSYLGLLCNPFYFARKGLFLKLKDLAPKISGKVLDVGCGNKPYLSLYNADEYVGLEVDSPENRIAKTADYYYDGYIFPLSESAFDSVVSNQVFEHVPDPDLFLDEIHRVLRPAGLLLITAPFVWDEHEQPHDYTRYSSFGMRNILEKHGFEIIEMHKTVNDIRIVFQMLNAYVYKKTNTNSEILNGLSTLFFMFPVNVLGEVAAWLTPSNNDLFLDNVVLARKK